MNPRTYPQGVPCWIDTTQPDVEAAAAFYGGLFGWTFEDAMPPGAPGRYLIARLGGQDVAGLGRGGEAPAAWSTYIAVDDADASARELVAAGAVLLQEPADAGEGGRSATFTDPQGAEFRTWQARRRPGAQLANQPGAWNFSDLYTPDPATATAFYTRAFGWEVDDLGFGLMVRRPGYGDHLQATVDPDIRARQAEIAAPPGFEDAVAWMIGTGPGTAPHWHVTFTVADRDRTAADAERLGGHILRLDEAEWTREAVIRDPQGAVFSASQFTPPAG
jgi:predicted enzyme related to lactoylglutathione lyase